MKRFAVLVILAMAARAHAAPPEFDEGEKLYKAGRYLDAAEKFRTAYEAEADPSFLLDAAQAYRFGEDCAHSAEYYRRYLEKMPDAPDIKTYIDEQTACAKQKAAAHPELVEKPVVVETRHKRGHPWLWAGITSAVVGGLAITYGYYEDSKLDAIASRRSVSVAHCTQTNVCSNLEYAGTVKPYDDLAGVKQRDGIIGYSVGAVGIGLALYLIISDATAGEYIEIRPNRRGGMGFHTWTF